MHTRVCMAESLCCSPETITALLVSCIPIQNKKFKKRKNDSLHSACLLIMCGLKILSVCVCVSVYLSVLSLKFAVRKRMVKSFQF